MENFERNWGSIYRVGAIATVIFLLGVIVDMVVGTVTGGNLAELPQTAIERFSQFRESPFLGLYNLDLLNTINQIIIIPSFIALYAAHLNACRPQATLALILFLVGTSVFISGNTALTMLDLSHKYFTADSPEQKLLFAAAGEAMLVKGSHGNLGVFIGFVLPSVANVMMSVIMLKGKVFSRLTALFGLAGNSLMVIYLILVTFSPAVEQFALIIAMPAGLLVMTWMIVYTIKLFKMSKGAVHLNSGEHHVHFD